MNLQPGAGFRRGAAAVGSDSRRLRNAEASATIPFLGRLISVSTRLNLVALAPSSGEDRKLRLCLLPLRRKAGGPADRGYQEVMEGCIERGWDLDPAWIYRSPPRNSPGVSLRVASEGRQRGIRWAITNRSDALVVHKAMQQSSHSGSRYEIAVAFGLWVRALERLWMAGITSPLGKGLLLMARSAAALAEDHGKSGRFRNVSDLHYHGWFWYSERLWLVQEFLTNG